MLDIREKTNIFAPQLRTIVRQFAQVAESVDALVSNTSGFTSIPVRPRAWVQTFEGNFGGFFIIYPPALANAKSPEKKQKRMGEPEWIRPISQSLHNTRSCFFQNLSSEINHYYTLSIIVFSFIDITKLM